MKKKILSFLLFTFLILPTTVLADQFYRIAEYKGDGNALSYSPSPSMTNYPYVEPKIIYNQQLQQPQTVQGYGTLSLSSYYSQSPINPNPPSNFSMKLVANEFDTEKSYQVIVTSATINYNETFTGTELNEGVTATFTTEQMAGGMATLQVKEANTTTLMNLKATSCDRQPTQACDTTSMAYQEYLITTTEIMFGISNQQQGGSGNFDEIMEQISPNGEIELDAIEPTGNFVESIITAALKNKYQFDGIELYGSIVNNQGELRISNAQDESDYNVYPVEYIFKTPNADISNLLNDVYQSLTFTTQEINSDYNKRFVVEDLESINYLYNVQRTTNPQAARNSIVNYSSAIHKLADNTSIDFLFDIRAGGGASQFYEMFMGPMNIIYDGTVYGNVDPIGYSLSQIIYVPSDTTKSRAAFIEAAESRIKEYLKGVEVKITYGGDLNDLEPVQYSWVEVDQTTHQQILHDLFDKTKTTGEWYNIQLGEATYKYFIVADSEKMNTPFVKTKDINTNIYVTTGAFDAPLDSKLSVTKLDKTSNEYKELEKKLKIIEGLAFDLNLYSTSLDMYIERLENGNFKVYIPVSEEMTKMNLAAAYIKDDGTIEEHKITFEGNYAVFETNHFSTYSIIEATTNPATGDKIMKSVIILGVCALGIAGVAVYTKKSKKNK